MKRGNYKTKKVVRTYTRKDGTVVTKEYFYGTSDTGYHAGDRKRARQVITKYKREGKGIVIDTLGRVRKKALNELIKRIKEDKTLSKLEKNEYIKKLKDKKYLDKLRGLQIQGIIGNLVGRDIELMIYHNGWTPTMLALELNIQYNENVTGNDIVHTANWDGMMFTSPYSQKHYLFEFRYDGFPMSQV